MDKSARRKKIAPQNRTLPGATVWALRRAEWFGRVARDPYGVVASHVAQHVGKEVTREFFAHPKLHPRAFTGVTRAFQALAMRGLLSRLPAFSRHEWEPKRWLIRAPKCDAGKAPIIP